MNQPHFTPEQTWQVKVVQDETSPEKRRFLLRAVHADAAWQEFTHHDDLLRHLWHLLDPHAGLR